MYVFLSNNETHTECIERMLVGTNNPGYYEHFFKKIKPGDWICVYNYNTYTLHGMYTACSTCAKDIEPDAWREAQTRGYPYQVRISGDYEFKTPLTLDDLFSLGGLREQTRTEALYSSPDSGGKRRESLGLFPQKEFRSDFQ